MSLKKLESDMLEQVFNIFLNIPDNILVSIPGIKSPSVVTELKRMRQKIKNKIKMGNNRLTNEYSKPSTSRNNSFCIPENKSKTSFVKGFDSSFNFLHEKQNVDSPMRGLTRTDNNSRLSTAYNKTNMLNESDNPNKWFESHSDFQMSSTLPTTSYNDIYTRERLTINELESVVNNDDFDSFSVSDVTNSVQTCSVNNNDFGTHTRLETNQSQNGFRDGKQILFKNIFQQFNLIIFLHYSQK